jgi:hypothetical protein
LQALQEMSDSDGAADGFETHLEKKRANKQDDSDFEVTSYSISQDC